MKTIFFGSGQFSLPIIKRLHDNFALLGVVATKPRPKGRGLHRSLSESAEWIQDQDNA